MTKTPDVSDMQEHPRSETHPLTDRLENIIETWARSQYQLVVSAAEFADSLVWARLGSPTAAHWLATTADVEACTAREWIRIGRKIQTLPETADAFEKGEISYSKVRALTRLATEENEQELVAIARTTSAGSLGRALATWLNRNTDQDELAARHHQRRSLKWRLEPDGMIVFTLRLPPLRAGMLIVFLRAQLMLTRPRIGAGGKKHPPSTVAQQHADAFQTLLTSGGSAVHTETEVVVHVRADGNTLDDGTPIPDNDVAKLIPNSFISALIHDAEANPIDATNRRRFPTRRQRRLVNERIPACVDCGRAELLEYDHSPPYRQTGRTVTAELERRCAPCHRLKHVA